MLRLEAEAAAVPVDSAAPAGDHAVEEVAGVELDAGLLGADLEGASGDRLVDDRGAVKGAYSAVRARP